MRWEDVLDKQHYLWQFYNSPQGEEYIRGYTADKQRKYNLDEFFNVLKIQQVNLFHAEPIAVEPDMMTLIEAAQATFQPEPLQPTDLLTPTGFLYLPKPLLTQDIWGKTIAYRAIAWMPAISRAEINKALVQESSVTTERLAMIDQDQMGYEQRAINLTVRSLEHATGIWLSLYSDLEDRQDDYTREILKDLADNKRAFFPSIGLGHITPWRFGTDYTEARGSWADMHDGSVYAEAGIDYTEALAKDVETLRKVQALWRLMQQTITIHSTKHPDRPTRRRIQKTEFPPREVTVIYLRRPKHEPNLDPEHKQIDWRGRWLVAGYWRWQPTKTGLRQIWVSPHIKGPEDKPLIIREKRAFVFGR